MRPRVGVTGPDRGGLAAWLFTALAVCLAGGRPRRIRPRRPVGIAEVDALIIGGGADVSPALYGQARRLPMGELADRGVSGWRRAIGYVLFPLLWLFRRVLTKSVGGLDPARDALEQRLIAQALSARMPVLGICRGMQLINVAREGSLHQSLEGFYDEVPEIRSVLPRKRVAVVEGSRLARIFGGAGEWRVNALHRQAIDRLGQDLTPAAHEPNGVLQAFEGRGGSWLIGVQWHPEYLPQRTEQRALFRALIEAARERP